MIEIKARSPQDGWAFVEEGGATFLLYPPFRARHPISDPHAVERAITTYGFEADDREFADWASVIKALSDEYVDAVGRRTSETPNFDLIRFAPAETLRTMIERVVEEFIPAADLDAAERLIADILASNAATEDGALRERAVDALRQLTKARQQASARAASLTDMTARIRELAPLASERYTVEAIGSLTAFVRDRGLWSMLAA